ncbi:MAG: hypothetical protein EXR72_17150 [Myxococcales bacterium]|nr:hypothetical protein [Myxococcales bacterium]
MNALQFLVGKEVDIFNPEDTEAVDGLMASGRILGVNEGWLVLANPKTGEPDLAVNLAHVGMIAVREAGPLMEALPGGKIHRLHRPPDEEK